MAEFLACPRQSTDCAPILDSVFSDLYRSPNGTSPCGSSSKSLGVVFLGHSCNLVDSSSCTPPNLYAKCVESSRPPSCGKVVSRDDLLRRAKGRAVLKFWFHIWTQPAVLFLEQGACGKSRALVELCFRFWKSPGSYDEAGSHGGFGFSPVRFFIFGGPDVNSGVYTETGYNVGELSLDGVGFKGSMNAGACSGSDEGGAYAEAYVEYEKIEESLGRSGVSLGFDTFGPYVNVYSTAPVDEDLVGIGATASRACEVSGALVETACDAAYLTWNGATLIDSAARDAATCPKGADVQSVASAVVRSSLGASAAMRSRLRGSIAKSAACNQLLATLRVDRPIVAANRPAEEVMHGGS